eukprot:scaffold236970_cov19-Tisochrysis_lutea.AAC.1
MHELQLQPCRIKQQPFVAAVLPCRGGSQQRGLGSADIQALAFSACFGRHATGMLMASDVEGNWYAIDNWYVDDIRSNIQKVDGGTNKAHPNAPCSRLALLVCYAYAMHYWKHYFRLVAEECIECAYCLLCMACKLVTMYIRNATKGKDENF